MNTKENKIYWKGFYDGMINSLHHNLILIKGQLKEALSQNDNMNKSTAEEKNELKYICKKCKVKCYYAPGLGEYCPKCGSDYNLEIKKERGKKK